MHMRLGSAPEQLLSTADYSLNDAFDDKSLHADSAAHYNGRQASLGPSRAAAGETARATAKEMPWAIEAACAPPCWPSSYMSAAAFGPMELLATRSNLLLLTIICDNRSIKPSCALC